MITVETRQNKPTLVIEDMILIFKESKERVIALPKDPYRYELNNNEIYSSDYVFLIKKSTDSKQRISNLKKAIKFIFSNAQ